MDLNAGQSYMRHLVIYWVITGAILYEEVFVTLLLKVLKITFPSMEP